MNGHLRRLPFVLANALGVAAFCWPLFLAPPARGEGGAHAVDAPVLIAMFVPLLVIVAIQEARSTQGDARLIALLGALVAVNSVLRIPKGPTGEGLVFVLPILAGWAISGRFAFLLGAFTMLVSAVLTGGVGPWLPFQMLALGWVGLGAALLRRSLGSRAQLPALGMYAFASSVAYGFAMTLWFWPFLGSRGEVFFVAGAGLAENLVRYVRFYSLTSMPWDTARALLTNIPVVLILARPVCLLLERTRERFAAQVTAVPADEAGLAPASRQRA